MHKTLLSTIVAGALALASCSTPNGVTPNSTAGIVAEVQSITTTVCDFVPLASTIINIFSTGSFSGVTAIANAICAAVTAKSGARRRGSLPTVAGVPVRGYFVR